MKGELCPRFCARAGVVAASLLVSALSVLLLAGRGFGPLRLR